MELIYSLPREVEKAKKDRVPVVIPVGTIEYHGPHCSYGCDGLIIEGLMKELSTKKDIVMYPTLWYTVGSYTVAGPEKNTMDIYENVFEAYVTEIVKNLLEAGWRNIYFVIHHQFVQEILQPMTLCCMMASKKVIMEYLEETRGRGWWGNNTNSSYYSELDGKDNPFNWIKVIPAMSAEVQSATGYDHAGEFETSFLGHYYPEAIEPERLSDSDEWFIQSARLASKEMGEKMAKLSLEYLMRKIL